MKSGFGFSDPSLGFAFFVLMIGILILAACEPATPAPQQVTWSGQVVSVPGNVNVYFFESPKMPQYVCAMIINYPDSLTCSFNPSKEK